MHRTCAYCLHVSCCCRAVSEQSGTAQPGGAASPAAAAVPGSGPGTQAEAAASLLQALLVVVQDMGSPEGHFMQGVVEGRFALVAAAAWPAARPSSQATAPGAAAAPDRTTTAGTSAAGETLLQFCWVQVFEARGISSPLRQGLLRCLLLPLLEAAPTAARAGWFQSRVVQIVAAADAAAKAPASEPKLSACLAAYRLLEAMYRLLPRDDLDSVLVQVGGATCVCGVRGATGNWESAGSAHGWHCHSFYAQTLCEMKVLCTTHDCWQH